jgi:hypothetical protein
MHYNIIISVVVIIVGLQIWLFCSTLIKLHRLKSIFSSSDSSYKLKEEALNEIQGLDDYRLQKRLKSHNQKLSDYTKIVRHDAFLNFNPETYGKDTSSEVFDRNKAISFLKSKVIGDISTSHKNPILSTIITAINDYLNGNKGAAADFHLMKDIVDRNCDSEEEQIQTQIPIPLYLGLVGTMLGISIGIGFLWRSGGLSDLLNAESGTGEEGVEALLGGVALAMISSIFGIVLTTIGSLVAKHYKSKVEREKHLFLSWIQAKLLPSLPSGLTSALIKMGRNLHDFNSTFKDNTGNLGKALAQVNESYRLQAKLIEDVRKITDKDISFHNLQLYNALKSSTEEIGALGMHLQGITEHIEASGRVVGKIESVLDNEISQVNERIGAIKKAVGTIDNGIRESLANLKNNTDLHFQEYTKASVLQNQQFDDIAKEQNRIFSEAVGLQQQMFSDTLLQQKDNFVRLLNEQNKALHERSKEIDRLVAELQNLSALKSSMSGLERATDKQNQKIDELSKSIRQLAQMAVSGEPIRPEFPKWIKIGAIALGSLLFITCLSILVPQIIEWIISLINLVF